MERLYYMTVRKINSDDEEFIQDIDNSVFKLFSIGVSLSPICIENNGKNRVTLILDEDDEEEAQSLEDGEYEISPFKNYLIDTENNFTLEEQNIIRESGIKTLEDIIRSRKIPQEYKNKCISCYKYVKMRYETMNIEPFNGYNVIQINNYMFHIRICYDRKIKFSKCLGKKNIDDFHMIQMSY
jgi:hypothetical protein